MSRRPSPIPSTQARALGRALARVLAGAGILLAAACSPNKDLAGATSETTNGDIKASITLADGSPAARIKVYVVDDSAWLAKVADGRSVILDSGVADANGEVTLKVPRSRRCNLQAQLQAEGGGEGLIIRGLEGMLDSGRTPARRSFRLAPLASLSGLLRADTAMAETLRMAGTTYLSPVSGDGQFRFSGVPAGIFPLVAGLYYSESELPALARTVTLAAGQSLDSLDLRVSPRRVLIDDFEQGFGQTALGRVVGEGMWFARSDVSAGGNSTNQVSLIDDSSAYAGSSLRIRYVLGGKLVHPYSNVGFYVGTATIRGKVFDFTDVKALTFLARGRGDIVVRFSSKAVNREYLDSVHFSYSFPLTSAWTALTLPLDSLRVPDNAPAGLKAWPWSRAAKEVVAIDFKANPPTSQAGDTVDLDLDEVYLEGVPLEHFLP